MQRPLKTALIVLTLAALAAGAVSAYRHFRESRAFPEGLIQASGRFEGDTVTVASKVAGRILAMKVKEGDTVKAGQLLIELEDKAVQARYNEAQAAHRTAMARVEALRTALSVLQTEVPVQIAAAEAAVAAARAALEKAQRLEMQARKDSERYQNLVAQGSVSRQAAEKNELVWKSARDDINMARSDLDKATQALQDARIGPRRIEAKRMELAATEALVAEAQARVAEAQSTLEDLTLFSPSDGRVTTRLVEPGEVVNVGTPLLELVDLDNLFLKVFVPEKEIGKLRLDLPAQIYTDAFPDTAFPAQVRTIASRAEFTPKEVQTPTERVKLVFAVKLYLAENPNHCLTPGLPADAVIRWKENAPWARPRW